jgi:hypothetical protein
MKKILSIVAIGALFTSYGFADNIITCTGTCPASATVNFGSAVQAMTTDGTDKFIDATVAFDNFTLGSAKVVTNDLYVNTNTIGDVTMQIASTLMSLRNTDGSISTVVNETIALSYTYTPDSTNNSSASSTTDLSSAKTITTGKFSNKAGTLAISAKPVANQAAGNYKAEVAVTISAS